MLKPGSARKRELDEKAEAEKLAALLPSLTLAAEHLANSYDLGVHGRRRAGAGEDFWQFKQYGPDDPTTSIDWRQSAKREQVFIRQKEQETSESVWFWRDNTPGMHYGSARSGGTKAERATILTLALALLLSRGGEKFALLGRSEKATTGPTAFNRFARDIGDDARFDLANLLKADRLPRKSTVVLISDFLSPLEDLKQAIRAFIDLGCNGLLIHVADPAEVDLPFKGRTRFEGVFAEESLTLGRVEAVQEDYQALFQDHKESVMALANRFSWDYAFHRTDAPASTILAEAFMTLQVKGA